MTDRRETSARADSLSGPGTRPTQAQAEDLANAVGAQSGVALPTEIRRDAEAHFDADFSNVRVHNDRPAADAAGALRARAFTMGRHIAFNEGEFQPFATIGRKLLAHELAHIVQQRDSTSGRASFVRDVAQEGEASDAAQRVLAGRSASVKNRGGAQRIQADGQATSGAASGQASNATSASSTVTIVLRAPDDAYTQDVTNYVRNTLKEQVIEVDNIDEAATKIAEYSKQNNVKVSNVRIIGHGTSSGDIKMTPKGESGRRWVSADELEKLAADDKLKAKARDAMAQDSTVEFWGCYIAQSDKTATAIGDIFGSDVKSTEHELRTASDSFMRPAEKGETGQTFKGQKGQWIEAGSTAEIDTRVKNGNKELGKSFNQWLIARSKQLEAGGEIPAQADDAARIAAMRDIFDRSGGKIRRLQISSGGKNIHRSDKNWLQQWKVKKK